MERGRSAQWVSWLSEKRFGVSAHVPIAVEKTRWQAYGLLALAVLLLLLVFVI